MDVNCTSPHTAITTWSGFIYQGKVAIYHVLQQIINIADYDELVLQLDSLDDFSILDISGKIISIHQVKAKKTQYFSGYKDDFKKLESNAVKYDCNNAYFHLALNITDKTSSEIELSCLPVKVYQYDQNYCCALDEIDGKIEQSIKHLFDKGFAGETFKQTDCNYVTKARRYLDEIILTKVLEIHKIVHENIMSDSDAAFTQTIPFSEFINILQKDLNQEDLGEDYFLHVLLIDLHQYYQDYCIEHEGELTENELVKLSLYMKEIEGFSNEDMIKFICNIMPHREFKFKTLGDYKDNSFDKDGIQQSFLTIMNELKEAEFNTMGFFYWSVGDKSFSPTTIDKGKSHAGNVCKNILKNAQGIDLDVMFEGSNLITTDINVVSVTDRASDIILVPEDNLQEDKRISRWKKVSLVSLNNAKGDIND
jgi:hypothetical protein